MYLTPPAPTGPPEAVLPLAALFVAISGQYLASYCLGRRALVIWTLLLIGGVGCVTWKLWSLAIAESRTDVPWAPMAGFSAGLCVIAGFAICLFLIICAVCFGWRHYDKSYGGRSGPGTRPRT